MDNNIKELMEKMKTDPAFAEKVNEIETKYPKMTAEKKEALLSLAKEEGFDLSEDIFETATSRELSDDELDNVTGGFFITLPWWKQTILIVTGNEVESP